MKPARRVLVMGAYGQDNLGDEALLEVHLQQLRRYDLAVLSSNPAQTSARYGVPSVRTYGEGRLRTLAAFARADALVYGGGSLLKELKPPHSAYQVVGNVALASLAGRAAGKRVAMSAMGAERLPSAKGRSLARRAVDRAHLVMVRDEASAALLRSLGVERAPLVTADPVFLLDADASAAARAAQVRAPLPGRLVVLNPMTSSEVEASPQAVEDAFVALGERILQAPDASVLLAPFKTAGEDADVPVTQRVLRRLASPRAAMAPLDLRPSDMLALLKGADLFVGMRHHGVLLAAHAGARVLAIPYAAKTRSLADELGLPARLDASGLSPEALLAAHEDVADGARADPRLLDAMRARARDNFARLDRFLQGERA